MLQSAERRSAGVNLEAILLMVPISPMGLYVVVSRDWKWTRALRPGLIVAAVRWVRLALRSTRAEATSEAGKPPRDDDAKFAGARGPGDG